ncbi:mitochondrial respiratory chain complex III protein [Malassezia pachydermatis]|uniref:Uncharacterized protein n=1 Tax=Malassezia pachydermatis TaxID=77020 RepID=A0A0M8MUB6_9BASI|nr:hypothetical protein Malapachy_3800 [Malassezia pachydermatis]KOS13950.1 hypothetical protein Malapachy_3800 [Malassezia pachydermatis]
MFRASPATMAAFRATSRAAIQKPVFQAHVGPYNAQYAFKWVPSLFFWGFTGGVFVTLALSGVPLFKKDVLVKSPVAFFYEDKTPDCDKPF